MERINHTKLFFTIFFAVFSAMACTLIICVAAAGFGSAIALNAAIDDMNKPNALDAAIRNISKTNQQTIANYRWKPYTQKSDQAKKHVITRTSKQLPYIEWSKDPER